MTVDKFSEVCESSDYPISYDSDVAIVVNEVELKELHEALNEWVAENNIVKVELVAKINRRIEDFMERTYEKTA